MGFNFDTVPCAFSEPPHDVKIVTPLQFARAIALAQGIRKRGVQSRDLPTLSQKLPWSRIWLLIA